MEKKLPGVFANKVNGKAGNNEDVYYSHGTTEKNEAEGLWDFQRPFLWQSGGIK